VRYPLVLHLAAASQVLPLGAAAWKRANLTPARRWILVWCALNVLSDAALIFAAQRGNNLWLRFVSEPLRAGAFLWALSLWQVRPRARATTRTAIVLLLPAMLIVALAAEGPQNHGEWSGPAQYTVLLAGAVYTMVARSVGTIERVAVSDWFWVNLGASLYFALNVALGPAAQALLHLDLEMLKTVLLLKARVDVLAFALIAVGMLCPSVPRSEIGGRRRDRALPVPENA
jgi:hypothetical protein